MPEEIKIGCGSNKSNDPKIKKGEKLSQDIETKEEMSMIQVGKPAPSFKAQAYHDGKFINVDLEDYRGKWVLLCFYPGDFTFVWATEVSAVAAKHEELQDLDVEVLSMSVDSPFVHKMWNDHELSKIVDKNIPFPMGSDSDGSIGKMYGIYNEDDGVENRGRFIIDPDGIVQGFEVLTSPVGRNIVETIRQVKAYQLVRETKENEVTPAGWKPGKSTLKPGPELVGNVWKKWKIEEDFED